MHIVSYCSLYNTPQQFDTFKKEVKMIKNIKINTILSTDNVPKYLIRNLVRDPIPIWDIRKGEFHLGDNCIAF